jgi:hypothetical protein
MMKVFSFLANFISSLININIETKRDKYRRDMVTFLNQAQDRVHLEYLEREWERTHGRVF